ncbi:MAG: PadR family transcriptional regulator [Solirubrobacterales bacterium]|nr:PadR family transcriptional regulator [Solirubrobacterales bacterium]
MPTQRDNGDLRLGGLVTLLILHFVAREPSYGQQLIERIATLTAGALRVNPNTMYPMLRSLEKRGLIEGQWEHPDRRSRRFYTITPAGETERRELGRQLTARLESVTSTVESIRRELLGR